MTPRLAQHGGQFVLATAGVNLSLDGSGLWLSAMWLMELFAISSDLRLFFRIGKSTRTWKKPWQEDV